MGAIRIHWPFQNRVLGGLLSGCAAVAVTFTATVPVLSHAETYGLHLGSRHDAPGFNNSNLGAYAQLDNGLTFGTFENSVSRQSLYIGKTWHYPLAQHADAALTLGGITGYDSAVSALVVPSLAWEFAPSLKLRSAVLFRVKKNGANAIHLMLEKEFR